MIAGEISLVVVAVKTEWMRNDSGERLASGGSSKLKRFKHAVLSQGERLAKKFGGRKRQTAIKSYNLLPIYTIDGDKPSREESILKQEMFQ